MKQLNITVKRHDHVYPVFISNGLSSVLSSMKDKTEARSIFHRYNKIAVITDENIAHRWISSVESSFSQIAQIPITPIVLPSGESEKTISSVTRIWHVLQASGFDRRSLIINLGGGVIGDMGGFAASTYMRGIDFIQIPTTLLAMVDASIGGKTGINFGGIKNSIGCIRQPEAVILCTNFLQSLPQRELHSGWAEIIKHGLIADATYFQMVSEKPPKSYTDKELIKIIHRSCEIKSAIVADDETESGSRKMLNFGHTIGHAIEAFSHDYAKDSDSSYTPLSHGEAISVGMIAEAYLSWKQGLIDEEVVYQIENAVTKAELPTRFVVPGMSQDQLYQALYQKMTHDKKNAGGQIKWVLLQSIGSTVYDITLTEDTIRDAVQIISSDKQSK